MKALIYFDFDAGEATLVESNDIDAVYLKEYSYTVSAGDSLSIDLSMYLERKDDN